MWSYLEAIRAGISLLFVKAVVARADLRKRAQEATAAYQAKVAAGTAAGVQDPQAALDLTIRKHQEALLRDAVRCYNNGYGHEFVWGHPHGYVPPPAPAPPAPMSWVIQPKVIDDYPNRVLRTNDNYNQVTPIEFTQFVIPP
jgi:hypothetical protein